VRAGVPTHDEPLQHHRHYNHYHLQLPPHWLRRASQHLFISIDRSIDPSLTLSQPISLSQASLIS